MFPLAAVRTVLIGVLMLGLVARRRHDVAVRVTIVYDVIVRVIAHVVAVEVQLADGVRPVSDVRKRSPESLLVTTVLMLISIYTTY